jgi:HD-GYP domain-containing protein (c-di-GMP phosphodiesterase class II)
MRLSRPVYGQKGQLLLSRGIELNNSFIKGLKEHNVLAATVESKPHGGRCPDDQEAEIVLEESVRAQAMSSLKNWAETSGKQDGIASIAESVSTIVDEILYGKIPSGGLTEISVADVYTFAHSIDVCALSVYMGIRYGYSKDDLLVLGTGSILHDLGKTKVSPEILNKPGPLTSEEFAEVKNHTIWGYQMLKEYAPDQVSDSALDIVLNHHERYDGSGYPRGLKREEISDMAGICALADYYNAMTTERVYRKAFPPDRIYEMIISYSDLYIKNDLVGLFSRCIYPYPIETLVLLSTEKVGCVTANDSNLPFRPVVTILGTEESIDLSGESSVAIERALTQDEAQVTFLRFLNDYSLHHSS